MILVREHSEIFYETHGSGENVVLLSHGYGASARMWQPQIEPLVAAGWQVVVWDMRGHGLTKVTPATPEQFTHTHAVGDMTALLDEVGATKAVVGGFSLGGYLSLWLHHMHPERVRGLMLFASGPGFRRDEARDKWNQYAEKVVVRLESKGLAAMDGAVESVDARHSSVEGLALAARGLLAQHDGGSIFESLTSIKVPTLVLVGADDKRFLLSADVMTAKIPTAHKEVVADAAHAVNLEQPDAFNEVMLGFLAQFGRGAA